MAAHFEPVVDANCRLVAPPPTRRTAIGGYPKVASYNMLSKQLHYSNPVKHGWIFAAFLFKASKKYHNNQCKKRCRNFKTMSNKMVAKINGQKRLFDEYNSKSDFTIFEKFNPIVSNWEEFFAEEEF